MAPYIYTKRGKIHIIDVKQTIKSLLIAKKLLSEIVSSGKDIVFVGTKRQAQKAVEAAAQKCQMHYVSNRWLGGTLTNFRTIRSRLARLESLEVLQQSGNFENESKKQASRLKREMKKIQSNLEGVRKMAQLPGAVVIVDAKKEYIALAEARKLGIVTIGVLDTDADPDTVDVVIPANDDSIRAVGLILNELADAVTLGKTMLPAKDARPKPKKIRSRSALARADQTEESAVESATASPSEQQISETLQNQPLSKENDRQDNT
jgi:small subunit ribosomal protein S2